MFLCCKLFAKILGEKDHKHINLDKARVVESEYLENVTDKYRRFKKKFSSIYNDFTIEWEIYQHKHEFEIETYYTSP